MNTVDSVLLSGNRDKTLETVAKCNKLFSSNKDLDIDSAFECGVIDTLLGLAENDRDPKLQFEVCSAIFTITLHDSIYIDALLDCGVVTVMLRLMHSQNWKVRETAMYILTNIAADSIRNRDMLVQKGLIPAMCHVLDDMVSVDNRIPFGQVTLCAVTWLMSSIICRCVQAPCNADAILLAYLPGLLRFAGDRAKQNILDIVHFFIQESKLYIILFHTMGIFQRLLVFQQFDTEHALIALKIMEHMEESMIAELDLGLHVVHLLRNPDMEVCKKAFSVASRLDMCAELPALIAFCCREAEKFKDMHAEMIPVVANTILGTGPHFIVLMMDVCPLLETLCMFLDVKDDRLLLCTLACIHTVLCVDEDYKERASPDKIAGLRTHECNGVCLAADKIIARHFRDDKAEEGNLEGNE